MDAAVQRITATAMTDDGYRAQLVTLADSHGGIYRRALDTVYANERETLGEEQARARVFGDEQLLEETRQRERRRKLVAELEHAGTLAAAAEQAEAAARALRDHTRSKLVRMAGEDEDLRRASGRAREQAQGDLPGGARRARGLKTPRSGVASSSSRSYASVCERRRVARIDLGEGLAAG
jgi:hypothetical protein